MKQKYLMILLIFVAIIGCSRHYPIKPGRYKSVHFGFIKWEFKALFSGLIAYHCGSLLTINSDSTFIYKRQPYISDGRWYRDKDSLILVFQDCEYINDSIKHLFEKYNVKPYSHEVRKFLIRKNYFIRYFRIKDNKKSLEKLDYIAP